MIRFRKPVDGNPPTRESPPRAVVYRGRSSVDVECAEAVARLLKGSPWRFDVGYVGPGGEGPVSAETLRGAALYAQPGGEASLRKTYRRLRAAEQPIRDYVAAGGRYLGVCLGGYLAGATPGFGLLPGDTDRYIDTPGAEVSHDGDAVVPVLWNGQRRCMFFQDGPHFVLDAGAEAQVLARYPNGAVAALVAPYGSGSAGVVGPHPEATADWFDDLPDAAPAPDCTDLGERLLEALMLTGATPPRAPAPHRPGTRHR